MTRNDYLQELDKHLKKLPQQDYREAMDYFTEYLTKRGLKMRPRSSKSWAVPRRLLKKLSIIY